MDGGADEDVDLAQPPESTATLLGRIAEILRVEPSYFFEPHAERACTEMESSERDADLDELLCLFRRIADPDLRRSALRLIRALRDGNGAGL